MKAKIPIRAGSASAEDKERVKAELAAILATDPFSSSKRYPAFLTYIVETTLDGRSDELKERSIGIEVFKRKPDFDTSADTVVRFTAGEVRKRLHSIYLTDGRTADVQIDLPTGSYVPEFFRLIAAHEQVETAEAHGEMHPAATVSVASRKTRTLRLWLLVACLVCGVAAGVLVLRSKVRPAPTSLERFWQPLRTSSLPIIAPGAFVISTASTNPGGRLAATKNDSYPYTSMATAEAVADVTTVLTQQHEGYILRHSGAVTLRDMTEHPAILIGGYDNDWTVRLLEDLRFRFSPYPRFQIYDSMDPTKVWTRPMGQTTYGDVDDYAIVARWHDRLTENTVVLIAGISKNGTASASQFVSSSQYLDMLDRPATKDWAQKNVEIILKTSVIDGKTGPPTIERIYLW